MTYSDEHIEETYYAVFIHVLILTAVAEFGLTVLYYLYVNYLQKIKWMKTLIMNINENLSQYYNKFKVKSTTPANMEPAGEYEYLQEELLLADPVH